MNLEEVLNYRCSVRMEGFDSKIIRKLLKLLRSIGVNMVIGCGIRVFGENVAECLLRKFIIGFDGRIRYYRII